MCEYISRPSNVPVFLTTSVRVQEAIEKKEKRARRFHFSAEENLAQKNVVLDRDVLKKGMKS